MTNKTTYLLIEVCQRYLYICRKYIKYGHAVETKEIVYVRHLCAERPNLVKLMLARVVVARSDVIFVRKITVRRREKNCFRAHAEVI